MVVETALGGHMATLDNLAILAALAALGHM